MTARTTTPSTRRPPHLRTILTVLILTLLTLLTHHLSLPPTTLKPHVFILGLSKTGTTSIGDALSTLGYRRLGWRDIRSRHIVHAWRHARTHHERLAPLFALTERYDALEDLPWPFVYRDMAARYPEAKFVLSLRRDEAVWVESLRRHVGRGRWEPHRWFYGVDLLEGEAEERIAREVYRNHTREVREFFLGGGGGGGGVGGLGQGRYVEISIDDPDEVKWARLCAVTGECGVEGASEMGEFPRANTAKHWEMGRWVGRAHWVWGWMVTRLEEVSSLHYYGRSSSAWVRSGLGMLWSVFDVVEQACSEVWFLSTQWWKQAAIQEAVDGGIKW